MIDMRQSIRCVVDASVAVKLYLAEEGADRAYQLFQANAYAETVLHVPELFFIEVTNIMWTATQRQRLSIESARNAIHLMHNLRLTRHPMSVLMVSAFDIAARHNISAYDAAYVALAQRLGLPMITADARLHRAIADGFDVQLL